MSDGFVREAFYIEPPKEGATVAEWEAWLKADGHKAAAAKAAFTKGLEYGDSTDLPEHLQPQIATVSIGGKHTQRPVTGMTGSEDGGDFRFEVAVPATQEEYCDAEILKAKAPNRRGSGKKRLSRNQRKKVAKLRAMGREIDWRKI